MRWIVPDKYMQYIDRIQLFVRQYYRETVYLTQFIYDCIICA